MQSSPAQALSPSSLLPLVGLQTALFLDFDGTLTDLAPQPDAVQVTDELVPTLRQLQAQLNGALAIVSGRPLTELDGFLAPLQLPMAAEHGAQCRWPSGDVVRLASPDLYDAAQLASAFAAQHAGLHVEIKTAGVALHYRHAPALELQCLQVMQQAISGRPGLELLCGKFVFEVKPTGVSKGTAIAAFMAQPPFAGRVPLFAGDDVTDEAGFASVQRFGGQSIKIGEGATLAHYRCATPAAFRQWLQSASQQLGSLSDQQDPSMQRTLP
jgi:trehalose 6-phosphate phosphatase